MVRRAAPRDHGRVRRSADDRDLPIEPIELPLADLPARRERRRRPRARWLAAGVVAALALGAVLVVGTARSPHRQRLLTLPPLGADPRPETIRLGRPLLKVPASWELVVRGPQLLRIRLRRGIVVRTNLAPLQSTGPIFMVVEPALVLIRPLDEVPGYQVPDGGPAQDLHGLLGVGGPLYPAADPQHLWSTIGVGPTRQMVLVTADGRPSGPTVPMADSFPTAADQTGSLIATDATGTYLFNASGRTLVTTGTLLAVGPSRWLTAEDGATGCELIVTDRATAVRHRIGPTTCPPGVDFAGLIAPDGSAAAYMTTYTTDGGTEGLHLVDLSSGSDRLLSVAPAPPDGSNGRMVWSPDSKTLFFLSSDGEIVLSDHHGNLHLLDLALPAAAQLAFRISHP